MLNFLPLEGQVKSFTEYLSPSIIKHPSYCIQEPKLKDKDLDTTEEQMGLEDFFEKTCIKKDEGHLFFSYEKDIFLLMFHKNANF